LQHSLPHCFPAFRSQQEAVLCFSFPPPSLQQEAADSSSFMQDLASLPAQQDFSSFPVHHEAMSFPAWLCMQATCPPFASDIWSQQAHFAFSVLVPAWGVDEVFWVAVCAQETKVRARIDASIFGFINSPSAMNLLSE